MDMNALKTDLRTALSRLPPEFLQAIGSNMVKHRDVLVTQFPRIVDELKPHIQAGMFEGATGILDTAELEAALMEVIGSFGVELPKP